MKGLSARLYIIAGNHNQARRYAGEKGLSVISWRYVHDVDAIRGIQYPRIALVGTWYDREDKRELGAQLLAQYIFAGPDAMESVYAGMARELAR